MVTQSQRRILETHTHLSGSVFVSPSVHATVFSVMKAVQEQLWHTCFFSGLKLDIFRGGGEKSYPPKKDSKHMLY